MDTLIIFILLVGAQSIALIPLTLCMLGLLRQFRMYHRYMILLNEQIITSACAQPNVVMESKDDRKLDS